MAEHAANTSRKRRLDADEEDSTQHRAIQISSNETWNGYPPQFWDKLSEIQLTRGALKEFDRRRNQDAVITHATTVPSYQTRRLLRSDYRRLKSLVSSGEPDLGSIFGYAARVYARGHIETSQSNLQSWKMERGTSVRKTGPYSSEFEQALIDIGIYPDGYQDANVQIHEPSNLVDLREALAKRRPSMSTSTTPDSVFLQFNADNNRARKDSTATADVISAIKGLKDKDFNSAGNTLFTRLEKFDEHFTVPQPGKYYGAKPENIDTRVRHDLDCYIIPSSQTSLPAVPNFFLEVKAPKVLDEVVWRKALYAGAIGARGIVKLQNYRNQALTYDGNAYTISATYCDGLLKMYATHPRESPSGSGETEYYMTQLSGYFMTSSPEAFREGATAYRNARDLMKEERDRFIANANAIAQRRSETASISGGQDSG